MQQNGSRKNIDCL